MRRLTAYLSALCAALLLIAGMSHLTATGEGTALPSSGVGAEAVAGGQSALTCALEDSYGWYIGPSSDPVSVSGNNTGGGAAAGARCSWLTGMRRELSSPVYQAADLFLTYLGRESSARSFASWRTALCGGSCAGGISVSRPGDGYIYALRRIVI